MGNHRAHLGCFERKPIHPRRPNLWTRAGGAVGALKPNYPPQMACCRHPSSACPTQATSRLALNCRNGLLSLFERKSLHPVGNVTFVSGSTAARPPTAHLLCWIGGALIAAQRATTERVQLGALAPLRRVGQPYSLPNFSLGQSSPFIRSHTRSRSGKLRKPLGRISTHCGRWPDV